MEPFVNEIVGNAMEIIGEKMKNEVENEKDIQRLTKQVEARGARID